MEMSMYNLVAGDGHQQNRGDILLALLGNPDPGRYRDAWVERSSETGDPIIAIYTRNGGGNRECWCDEDDEDFRGHHCYQYAIDGMQAHALYVRDADDDFDSTYATFYFRAPEEHREMLREIAQDPVDTSQRWIDLIDALKRRT